jgi:hypothetical protein
MTIPELMYGARRYNAQGYSGDDFIRMRVQATGRASSSGTFAAIAIRDIALSVVWFLLFIIVFGLLVTGIPSLLLWRALKSSRGIGAVVETGMLKPGLNHKMLKYPVRKDGENYHA